MTIHAPVGRGGGNRKRDVLLIQRALNIVRRASGQPPIREDGEVGPETINAISDFQRQHTSATDGRIDPHGPTLRALEDRMRAESEPVVRAAALGILHELETRVRLQGLQLPPAVRASLDDVSMAAQLLRSGPVRGISSATLLDTALRPRIQFAMAAAAPAAAAAGAMEAAILALMALMALLIVIQSLPAMGRTLEDLLRRIQVAMSVITDQVKTGLEIIEELIRNNAAAGMRCSAQVLAFRQLSQQILDVLVAPRPTDELGRRRWQKQLMDLMNKWHDAFNAVLACMGARV